VIGGERQGGLLNLIVGKRKRTLSMRNLPLKTCGLASKLSLGLKNPCGEGESKVTRGKEKKTWNSITQKVCIPPREA